MALTLSATFDESTGTILLQSTSSSDHVYGAYTITRSDANGSATVRTQAGLGFSSGTIAVLDHEPALSGLVTYVIAAGLETASASVTPTTARTWLKFPIMPHLSLELPTLGTNYDSAYDPDDNVYPALDRDDPIVVFGAFGLRSGSFEILCPTHDQAMAIAASYRATRVGMLQNPDPSQVSMYHTVNRIAIAPFAPRTTAWILTGTYVEVGRPTGPVLGTLGWSYADVATDYTAYSDVVDAFAAYGDLTVGPTS